MTSLDQTAPMSEAVLEDIQDDVMADPELPQGAEISDDADIELDDATADLELLEEASEDEDEDENGFEDEDANASEDGMETGGARLSPSAIPAIGGMESTTIPSLSLMDETSDSHSINPTRPTPYVHDAGHLLVTDPNPLPKPGANSAPTEAALTANTRDAVQSLLNHLLTTCPITANKTATSGSGVSMALPTPTFQLPREKRVPQPKAATKWEKFAAKKGIGKNKRKGQEGEDQAGKKVYDEASGEWVPKYGYKGKNKQGENDWLVEVDEKEERRKAQASEAGKDPRNVSRAERKDRIKRNERKMRANERQGTKGK